MQEHDQTHKPLHAQSAQNASEETPCVTITKTEHICENASTSLLDSLQSPAAIATMSLADLELLAKEVRQRIIQVVAKNGGHLAPSLGVVELTLALLHSLDSEKDKFIWDVGHQAYAWKLLTGRAQEFATLRQMGGLSGFPRVNESAYDHFGVGHASTSISAGLGMVMARDLAGEDHRVVTVIGDGSLTGGQAFEGLNTAGQMGNRFIVVLNDNEMSISSNVGALSRFLSRNLSRRWVRQAKKDVLKMLRSIPRIGDDLATYAIRGEVSFKTFFTPGMLFEALRFTYIGPVDGHDLVALKRHIAMAAAVEEGPVLLHVLTQKGKGYAPAEENPSKFHGIGSFDLQTGKAHTKSAVQNTRTFTDAFSSCLLQLGKEDDRIVAITAAMPEGTGTQHFQSMFPERFVDVGICEQHSVTFAAGLAMRGFRPVVALYSTFLQRAYDQVVHDVCLQNLPVTFCIDRAGLVGEDGPTHHGIFDMAYLRHIPQLQMIAPRDEAMLCHALATATRGESPVAIRYPRGAGMGVAMPESMRTLPVGQGEFLQKGSELAIIAVGPCAHMALEAAHILQKEHHINVTVYDPIWIKPLPQDALCAIAAEHTALLMVEEGCLAGGFSSAVLEVLHDKNAIQGQRIKRLGIGDIFIEHGKQQELRDLVGLTTTNILEECLLLLQKKV